MLTGGSIRMAQKMLHGGSMCAAPWFRERDMNESTINDPVQMEYASETPIQDKAGDKKAMTFRQIIVKIQISLAVLTALLSICFFFAGGYAGKRILCPPAAIAAVILLILAFKFPSKPFANAFAITGAIVTFLCIWSLPSMIPWEGGEFALSGSAGNFLGALQGLLRLTGFVTGIIFLFICSGEIKNLQDQRREMIQKAALAENDPDQLQRALAEFLRPDITFDFFLIGYFIIGTIVFFTAIRKGLIEGGKGPLIILAGFVVYTSYSVVSFLKSIRTPRLYIKHLSETGEFARMAKDFTNGKSFPEYNLVLGDTYLFRRGSGRVYMYKDIIKIYHGWSDKQGTYASPYWRLYMETADQKEECLAEIPFPRYRVNYEKKVLPLILEIRSRNEAIIISPLTSFRQ